LKVICATVGFKTRCILRTLLVMKLKLTLEGFRVKRNIYLALAMYLLLMMILFSLCRIGFYLFNKSFFPGISFLHFLRIMVGGLRFDLTAVLYTNALFVLLLILPFKFRFDIRYLAAAKWIFFITNSLALAANVCDFIYFQFTLRRTTADVFRQFENEKNMGGLLLQFLVDYWYALLFWILMVTVMVVVYKRIRIEGPMLRNSVMFYSSGVVAMLVITTLFVGGVRGGFQESTRPITLNDAGKYVNDPREVSLVLNTPFAIMRTTGSIKIEKVNYFPESALDSIYTPEYHHTDMKPFRKMNVVVIILESFSKEFIGAFNHDKENGTYQGYTPFLDSLIQYSKSYDYSFANGRKSIDALPSVVCSVPSLGVPYILTPYSGNTVNSLGSLLKKKGYHTSFFHGAPNGSMGFEAFMNVAGYDHYYGKTEYGNDDDYDGIWGIWDEKFFHFYANKLNEFPQPFVSSIFSVSSHHPFKIPKEYEHVFKGGREPILKCIQYTDFSLKRFFQEASRMPWYENTLFVITADHTSSNILFDETRTAWGFYSIPIIYFTPDHSLQGRDVGITQQIDIMPTILRYLDYDEDFIAFGRDAFGEHSQRFAFNYRDNVYQIFEGDYLLVFDGVKTVGLYNFKTDKMVQNNLQSDRPDVTARMEKKIKAIIQQYNNRLVDNRMTAAVSKLR